MVFKLSVSSKFNTLSYIYLLILLVIMLRKTNEHISFSIVSRISSFTYKLKFIELLLEYLS